VSQHDQQSTAADHTHWSIDENQMDMRFGHQNRLRRPSTFTHIEKIDDVFIFASEYCACFMDSSSFAFHPNGLHWDTCVTSIFNAMHCFYFIALQIRTIQFIDRFRMAVSANSPDFMSCLTDLGIKWQSI
jgi:hypothetical protein